MSDELEDRQRRAWYVALAAGLAPLELVGWVASAAADRWVFAVWALTAGAAYTLLLHRAFAGRVPAGAPLAALALAWALLAVLMTYHRQAWDLGLRAFLPSLYHPWTASPVTAWVLAALLGTGAAYRFRRTHP